jgi:cell division protein FtsX
VDSAQDLEQQELAVRAALGADAGRIARELLLESLALGLLGGLVGAALARARCGCSWRSRRPTACARSSSGSMRPRCPRT